MRRRDRQLLVDQVVERLEQARRDRLTRWARVAVQVGLGLLAILSAAHAFGVL